MKNLKIVLILIIIGLSLSCKSNYGFKTYVFDDGLELEKVNGIDKPKIRTTMRRSIVIVSDSTLNYNVMIHDFGASTTIKYKLENELLKIDTVDIYNRNSFQNYAEEIFGLTYKYSKDSLTDIRNGQKYYSPKIK
ncbi:hypothetical protein H7F37_04210 [Winogradskyella sp. PAMC22761]|jgi:hypothetical protein|nr:hypothetical protein H7F37_04210 [Winogradskyella sp. PAMC22761]